MYIRAKSYVPSSGTMYVAFDVGDERLAGSRPRVIVAGIEQATEILERKFGIDGNQPAAERNNRVNLLSRSKGALGLDMLRRQKLAQHVFQQQLAETATCFRAA
jgi:hypothetical protein